MIDKQKTAPSLKKCLCLNAFDDDDDDDDDDDVITWLAGAAVQRVTLPCLET